MQTIQVMPGLSTFLAFCCCPFNKTPSFAKLNGLIRGLIPRKYVGTKRPTMTKRNLLDGVKRGETTPENSPYHDGQGLYLQVDEGTDGERYRSWFFRYKLTDGSPWGTQKYKGLGSIEVISLAAARK